MAQLVEAKREGEDAHELLVPDTTEPDADGDVADLLAALRKSVETAQSRRGSASQETEPPAEQAGQEDASQEETAECKVRLIGGGCPTASRGPTSNES